jgi:hypothetical protein
MAVKANEFNDITTQLAQDTEKQLSDSENKQQEDIRAEEQRRRDEYEKARKEAERKSMGPLTALMHGDFERFGEALIEEDPLVMFAKGDFGGAINKFVDMNQDVGTVLLNTVGNLAFGLGPTIAAGINTAVDSAQRGINDASGYDGKYKANTSMSVQDQADLAKIVGDPNASAEQKAMASAQLLANASSFIPLAGTGAVVAKTVLQSAPAVVGAASSAVKGDLLGAGIQSVNIAGGIAGAVGGGAGTAGKAAGTAGKAADTAGKAASKAAGIGVRDVINVGMNTAAGIAEFAKTGNLDNFVNNVSGSAVGLLGKTGNRRLATGLSYGTAIATGHADRVGTQIAGTMTGNALRDKIQASSLGTGDFRYTTREELVDDANAKSEDKKAEAASENAARAEADQSKVIERTSNSWEVTDKDGITHAFASEDEAKAFVSENSYTVQTSPEAWRVKGPDGEFLKDESGADLVFDSQESADAARTEQSGAVSLSPQEIRDQIQAGLAEQGYDPARIAAIIAEKTDDELTAQFGKGGVFTTSETTTTNPQEEGLAYLRSLVKEGKIQTNDALWAERQSKGIPDDIAKKLENLDADGQRAFNEALQDPNIKTVEEAYARVNKAWEERNEKVLGTVSRNQDGTMTSSKGKIGIQYEKGGVTNWFSPGVYEKIQAESQETGKPIGEVAKKYAKPGTEEGYTRIMPIKYNASEPVSSSKDYIVNLEPKSETYYVEKTDPVFETRQLDIKKITTEDNSAELGPVEPVFTYAPPVPPAADLDFNPEYGWNYQGGDFNSGGSIGFQLDKTYTPESIVEPTEEETHNWVEYINTQYDTPLVYSDEELKKIKFYTIPKSRKCRETLQELHQRIREPFVYDNTGTEKLFKMLGLV